MVAQAVVFGPASPPRHAFDNDDGSCPVAGFVPLHELHDGIDEGYLIERKGGQVVTSPNPPSRCTLFVRQLRPADRAGRLENRPQANNRRPTASWLLHRVEYGNATKGVCRERAGQPIYTGNENNHNSCFSPRACPYGACRHNCGPTRTNRRRPRALRASLSLCASL
jgi:hypothetical protein